MYKGGFGVKYGGWLLSVVEFIGKDGNILDFNIGFGLSLFSVNGFLELFFVKGKGLFLIVGRRLF